ncbi:hypothetical protein LSUE1_G001952 [Lachnellula suecica]|uniref:Alpha-1,3-mannosyltransferase CMT1 n=1 Tax=Lachnellula suecica TaxID=602035 RepID=A0A8T9CFE2_9HELO|nr:hypothetical protein LSUE1_G001952 [Lachnellula suecica]
MDKIRRPEEFELLGRTSSESGLSSSNFSDCEYEVENDILRSIKRKTQLPSWRLLAGLPSRWAHQSVRHSRPRRSHRLYWRLAALPFVILLLLTIFTAIFLPSYTNLPEHYKVLEQKCEESQDPGRGNINDEKVLIAATLYDHDGLLLGGDWSKAVVELVQLLGPWNVHVSIYENDPDELAQRSLSELKNRLNCNTSIVSDRLALGEIPSVTLPSGENGTKRMAFLAEVRNRALRPLQDSSSRFDKILFLNDVMFNPIDAVQLLFSTNVDKLGRAQYGAACAVDFINVFKFYDRFATRDLEGYETGVPFFPWFTAAGGAASRQDVLSQTDAVRVRACWGGMTAFEASWFQKDNIDIHSLSTKRTTDREPAKTNISPLRFRYEPDTFWDASECCLIHADLTYLRHGHDIENDAGIYMNPYVRVAYDSKTLGWLPFTRRIERLYPFIHNIVNEIGGLPKFNPRRLEQSGDEVTEMVWEYDHDSNSRGNISDDSRRDGSYHEVRRTANPGRFCGRRLLSVLRDDAKEGEKKYMSVPLPLLPD